MSDESPLDILNKMGGKRLAMLGALVQRWENTAAEGLCFTDWLVNEEFIKTTERLFHEGADNTRDIRKELAETKEELSESKKKIKNLSDKIERLLPKTPPIDRIRGILSKFNRENTVAIATGGGATFDGYSKITSVESLGAFLASVHARELGVPSNILVTFKVFVLRGKLVTLSSDYHGGVGYSFLWIKSKKNRSVEGALGWSSVQAKRYDPRLGIDPATGVNYIDPATGKMWVHPVLSKKRAGASDTPESVGKKIKLETGSSASGSEKDDDSVDHVALVAALAKARAEAKAAAGAEARADDEVGKEEEGEIFI